MSKARNRRVASDVQQRMRRREFIRRAGLVGLSLYSLPAVLDQSRTRGLFAAPAPGGTLAIAIGSDAAQLTPHVGNATADEAIRNALFDNLVAFDLRGNVVAQLAESWESTDGNRNWVFKLRRGVRFHDGTALNARAVKDNFDILLAPSHPDTAAKLSLKAIESIESPDELTVKFNLREPYGPFLQDLASSSGAIVGPSALRRLGPDFDTRPVGAGPFKFVEWRKGESITFERFDEYWGGRAKLDRIVYKILPSASARTIALQTGDVDIAWQVNLADVPKLRQDSNVRVVSSPTSRTVMFYVNNDKKPFNDVKVRRALHYAIDRKAIIQHVLRGFGQGPACSLFGPGVLGQTPSECYDYDPNRARQLLVEAGYPSGFSMTLASPQGRYTADLEIAEAVAGQLRQVGVRATLRPFADFATYIGQYVRSNEFDIGLISIIAPNGDPSSYGPNLHSDNAGRPFNFARVRNREIDRLLEEGVKTVDLETRRKIYMAIQRIERQNANYLVLHYEVAVTGLRKNVEDIGVRPTYALIVRNALKQ